ncbi:DUF4238 domain-containing protein [Marinobacter salarius]|uniref:DUF4238 domain-containing protein n=1 Tax=Marinobacter salarius TaxID=1420917 RepID=UPI003BA9CC8B
MSKTRNNHFVPEWYQKGFMEEGSNQLCHLKQRVIERPDGTLKRLSSKKWQTAAQRFYQKDLYSTFFGEVVNDEIEQKLFGLIDDNGSKAVRAFLTDDQSEWHYAFQDLFIYLDAQKLRTPKGLDWIKSKYPELSQLQLMMEMQSLRSAHCTLWSEAVHELVSAEDSDTKFIISDHPVTVYNSACPPSSDLCEYPNDPDISLNGSQTIFPLDKNRCLILTNLDYAREPDRTNPLKQRINATRFRKSMVKTIDFINTRKLSADEVTKINHVIKSRAQSSVAAGKEEWLYPENDLNCEWSEIGKALQPPKEEIFRFGGELYAKFEDGSVYYQDAYGRTSPQNDHLNKSVDERKLGRNEHCGCGSGQKYKNCCMNVPAELRTTWEVASIRERNLAFCRCIRNVLGLDNGKTWLDVRRELSSDQIKEIYGFFSVLWPRETDVFSLLPKPDGKFRGLYTGQLDIRVIGAYALPMASFFDEYLIQNPIMNPNNVNPEFSPLKSPEAFKYQALKDLLFMLELEPYIGLGLVNLIPDPGDHDAVLMRSMMEMARDRRDSERLICERDMSSSFALTTEDLLNSTAMLPRKARIGLLKDQFGMPPADAEKAIEELESLAEASPLMLLQEVKPGKGGQFIQTRMAPNYDMALFLGQVTGSVLVTDSGTRWQQLTRAQHRNQGFVAYPWKSVFKGFKTIPIDYEIIDTFEKSQGAFSKTRDLMKSADLMVMNDDQDNSKLADLSCKGTILSDEIERMKESVALEPLKILSPEGGFYDLQVQRLLARSSCTRYDNKVRSIYGVGLP